MNERESCIGCGIHLQSDRPDEIGFVPNSALRNHKEILCQRCFRLKHYNETTTIEYTEDDFHQMISNIRERKGIVVHLVDLFDVDGSLIGSLQRFVGQKKILLVGNKIDLFPKSTNRGKLKHWFEQSARDAGLNIVDVCLISATKGYGLKKLKEKLDEHRDGQDVYVVGMTNVGKSTFINKLIQDSTGMKNVITTSYFPGTTLGFIQIPLDEKSYFIDTPGIVNPKQIVHYISEQDVRIIIPEKEIKPRIYQLENGQTLFFGGLIQIDIVKGEKQPYVCYVANELPIHRTSSKNAHSLYKRQLGKLLSPPSEQSLETFPDKTKTTFRLPEGASDIVIPGLGWITVHQGNVSVMIHHPKEVMVSWRKSFIQKGR